VTGGGRIIAGAPAAYDQLVGLLPTA
jgi:hypothetical protein